jgi:hypothetical protein
MQLQSVTLFLSQSLGNLPAAGKNLSDVLIHFRADEDTASNSSDPSGPNQPGESLVDRGPTTQAKKPR